MARRSSSTTRTRRPSTTNRYGRCAISCTMSDCNRSSALRGRNRGDPEVRQQLLLELIGHRIQLLNALRTAADAIAQLTLTERRLDDADHGLDDLRGIARDLLQRVHDRVGDSVHG